MNPPRITLALLALVWLTGPRSAAADSATPSWSQNYAPQSGWFMPQKMAGDSAGSVYVTGTYGGGPMTPGSHTVAPGTSGGGFVAKFGPAAAAT